MFGLNFPRAVILICVAGSGVLGWLVYQRSTRLEEIRTELVNVPRLVQDIQQLGIELDNHQKVASGELLKGQDYDAETYIRQIAADENVNIGQVRIQPNKRSPFRNVEDNIYSIDPLTKNQRYTRSQIGNFLYKLEADSRRVKVTNLKLTPHAKVKPGQIGNDEWTFEAEITTRTKVEG